MSESPEIRFGDKAVRLLLIKTIPGHEEAVFRDIQKRTGGRTCEILLTFGEYDLLVFLEEGPEQEALASSGLIPSILGVREVVCYEVAEDEEPRGLGAGWNPGRVYSVTFLRMPGFFTHLPSGRPEKSFVDWWFDRPESRSDSNLILGALGGPEFVSVYSARTFQEIDEWLIGMESEEVVAKTFSMLAIRAESFFDGTKFECGICPEGLVFEMRLACKPHKRRFLFERIRKLGESSCEHLEVTGMYNAPGAMDLIFQVVPAKQAPLGEILSKLVSFRAELQDFLLGTNVNFLFREVSRQDESGINRAEAPALSMMPLLSISPEVAKRIYHLPDVGPTALRALYQFNNMLSNETLNNDLLDMFLYFASFLDEAKAASSDNSNELQLLAQRLTLAHHGVDQRTIGSNEGINPVESNVRHLLGGTHRILQAAASIPMSVFKQFDNSLWPGFVVLGSFREFWGHHYQVIDLPQSSMWEPSEWTGLLHESVHGLITSNGDKFSSTRGLFSEILGMTRERPEVFEKTIGRSYADTFLQEVLVDLLELGMGPYWDVGLMLKARWAYLSRVSNLETLDLEHQYEFVARTLLVFLRSKIGFNKPERGDKELSPLSIDSALDELRAIYELWGGLGERLKALQTTLQKDLLAELTSDTWLLQSELLGFLPFSSEDLAVRKLAWNGSLSSCVGKVTERCMIQADDLVYPELFVWKLFEVFPNGMSIGQRTSAMLGLADWNRQAWILERKLVVES